MASSPSPLSPTRKSFSFIGKLWKPRASSVSSSNSDRPGSTSSPPFTPDSSISIYTTHSQDSDCSTSSNASSGVNNSHHRQCGTFPRKTGGGACGASATATGTSFPADDIISAISYNSDNERYAANMYYDVGEAASFEYRVPVGTTELERFGSCSSARTGSSSVPSPTAYENDDRMYSYYNTRNFTTFPNPRRRHSLAYSSCSSSVTSSGSSKKCSEEMIELMPIKSPGSNGLDGYLVPISDKRNKFGTKSKAAATGPASPNEVAPVAQEVVQVDVHTSESSDSRGIMDTSATSDLSDVFTSSGSTLKDSSRGTLLDDSIISNARANNSQVSSCGSSSGGTSTQLFYNTSSDCEPFCSICAVPTKKSSTTTSSSSSSWKSKGMDVAIVLLEGCVLSKGTEEHIRLFFDKMMIRDNQKMDVRVKTYDIPELDRQEVAKEVHCAKVQIIIISEQLLDHLNNKPDRKRMPAVNRVLRSKRVIAVLTEISATVIARDYQAVLARFSEWFSLELRTTTRLDPAFCKRFTEQILKIYNLELNQSGQFSLFPTKISKEQPKIHLMLKRPVDADDVVKVEISRGKDAQIVEKVTMTNPYTAIVRVPEYILGNKDRELLDVTLIVNSGNRGSKRIKYENQSKVSEKDLVEQMMKAAPNFRQSLDARVASKLRQHYQDCTDPLQDPDLELIADVLVSKPEIFPTFLHFAVHFELPLTVFVILNEGDGLEQSLVKNDAEQTPEEMSYGDISYILHNFSDMNMSIAAVNYATGMLENDATDKQLSAGLKSMALEEHQKVLDCAKKLQALGSLLEIHETSPTSSFASDLPRSPGSSMGDSASDYQNTSINTTSGPTPELQAHPTLAYQPYAVAGKPITRKRTDKRQDLSYANLDDPYPLALKQAQNKSSFGRSMTMPDYDIPRLETEQYQVPPIPVPVSFSAGKYHQGTSRSISSDSGYVVVENGSDEASMNDSESPVPESAKLSPIPHHVGHPRRPPEPSDMNLDLPDRLRVEMMKDLKDNVYTMEQVEVLLSVLEKREDVSQVCRERAKQLRTMRKEYKQRQQAIKTKRPSSKRGLLNFITKGFSKKESESSLGKDTEASSSSQQLMPISGGESFSPRQPPEVITPPVLHFTQSPTNVLRRYNPQVSIDEHDRSNTSSYVSPSPSVISLQQPDVLKDSAVSKGPTSVPPRPVKPKRNLNLTIENRAYAGETRLASGKPEPKLRDLKQRSPVPLEINGEYPPAPPPRTDRQVYRPGVLSPVDHEKLSELPPYENSGQLVYS